jgi:hypothetical protein
LNRVCHDDLESSSFYDITMLALTISSHYA